MFLPLSDEAVDAAVLAFIRKHAGPDGVCTEPLYPLIEATFGVSDPRSRDLRSKSVRRLTAVGHIRRENVRSIRVQLLDVDDPEAEGVDAERSSTMS